MRVLEYTMDEHGFTQPQVKYRSTSGHEMYLVNALEDLKVAIDAGAPFVAHECVGLKPRDVILNPAQIESVRCVS